LAYQPGFCNPLRLGEADRLNVLAAQAKTLAASREIRAGAGPGVTIQQDGVAAALAGNHPGTVSQDHHLHIAIHQGSLRPGHAIVLELILQNGGCGSHRLCITLLSCQKKNVWGLVSDVTAPELMAHQLTLYCPLFPFQNFRARQGSKP
jgi:hypothetical protein